MGDVMILSVSTRCDIPAQYFDWFINRINEGYVDVRNPMFRNNVSRIMLNNDNIDAIVFATKNPIYLSDKLETLNDYKCIFHVTITPYKNDIEPNVPDKKKVIEAFKKISQARGINSLVLRYDPILLNDKYTISYHIKAFEALCNQLQGYTRRVIISFIDIYKNTKNNSKVLNLKQITIEDINLIAEAFGTIANKYGMQISMCAEEYDLTKYGINTDSCINQITMDMLHINKKFKKGKLRNKCKCIETVDIGSYNCCTHFCKYCYANFEESKVVENSQNHNPKSSLILGELTKEDIIKIRK